MLKNTFYCGILTCHEEYVKDYLKQKKVKNYGEIDFTQATIPSIPAGGTGLHLDGICQSPMILEWRLQMVAKLIFRQYLSEKELWPIPFWKLISVTRRKPGTVKSCWRPGAANWNPGCSSFRKRSRNALRKPSDGQQRETGSAAIHSPE